MGHKKLNEILLISSIIWIFLACLSSGFPLHHLKRRSHNSKSEHEPIVIKDDDLWGPGFDAGGFFHLAHQDTIEKWNKPQLHSKPPSTQQPAFMLPTFNEAFSDDESKTAFPKKYEPPLQKTSLTKEEIIREELESKHEPVTVDNREEISVGHSSSIEDLNEVVTEPSSIFSTIPVSSRSRTWMDIPSSVSLPVSTTDISPSGMTKDDPLALPVTTEGKKPIDTIPIYGIPAELMPILPGGGSRFDDVEREKVEKDKMSQTKMSQGEESAESGSSHDAEGLYSSASVTSLSFCVYSIIYFLLLDRIIT